MSWAGNRRLLIVASILFVMLIVLAVILVITLPKEPTCSDGLMNQDESGIDCGGTCAYLCSADLAQPSVSYIRALEQNGRIDVVALVKNNEPSASVRGAHYTVELYSPEGAPLASAEGVMDLAPGEEVPVFIPGIAPTGLVIGRAFLSFDDATLNFVYDDSSRALPRADATQVMNVESEPRVTASVFNPSARLLRDVVVIAVVRDTEGAIMAASQTLIDTLGAQAAENVVFSWNEPFPRAAGPVEIHAVLPL